MGVPAFETLRIDGPQGKLQVQTQGATGTPTLLVHGNGGSGSQWKHQLAALGRSHRVAALDLRGMGDSDAPVDGDFSVGGLADDVAAVADALGFKTFVLAGHSLGGYVMASFAAKFPERLSALVFVDHGGDPRMDSEEDLETLTQGLAPERFEAFARQAVDTCLKGARPQVRDEVLDQLKRTPRAHFAGAVLGLMDFDSAIALKAFGGPKLHIYSSFLRNHNLTPIHAQTSGVVSVHVAGCSHWVHLDQPEVFNALFERFMEFQESPKVITAYADQRSCRISCSIASSTRATRPRVGSEPDRSSLE